MAAELIELRKCFEKSEMVRKQQKLMIAKMKQQIEQMQDLQEREKREKKRSKSKTKQKKSKEN